MLGEEKLLLWLRRRRLVVEGGGRRGGGGESGEGHGRNMVAGRRIGGVAHVTRSYSLGVESRVGGVRVVVADVLAVDVVGVDERLLLRGRARGQTERWRGGGDMEGSGSGIGTDGRGGDDKRRSHVRVIGGSGVVGRCNIVRHIHMGVDGRRKGRWV